MPNPQTSSPDVERYLLGVILRDALPLPPGIIPSDFTEPKHQDIASVIIALADENIAADELTATMRLRERKSPAEAFYLSELTTAVSHSALNPAWADEIKRLSALRTIATITAKATELANDPASDPSSILAYAEGSFQSVRHRTQKIGGPVRMDEAALLAFDRKDDPNTVLGNRWLCKGGSALIVSQAGVGKSSLMMQAAIHWAAGKDFFGIKAKRPLRIVICQAENDFGDVAESFIDCHTGAKLFPDERANVAENLAIFRDSTSVGPDFPDMLRTLIVNHRADLVFVDPLLSFAGINIADQEQASRFLRHDLNKVLVETQAVLIAMHHTTKPRSAKDKEGQTIADLAYSGAGSSEFVNYFREVAVLVRQEGEQPIFKFGLTKRRGRAGLKDINGDFAGEITIRHSRIPGEIRWEYANPEPIQTPAELPAPQKTAVKGSPRRSEW
ncbi:RepA RecA-family ATPase [uncultured Caudovirales phage]|uniref:RepA RecA-family ATPase n=1 Tax=uncultured Caudovirales phage TaxID=2100421 RepID=A0A6J5QRA9_9CAUD|nr:RepA RecA-family ATPase [uncultured Caudovirales phage]